MTTKRKRGEHKTRHPWSNATAGPIQRRSDFEPYDAWTKWRREQAVYFETQNVSSTRKMLGAFMAGYEAGRRGAKMGAKRTTLKRDSLQAIVDDLAWDAFVPAT